MKIATTLVFPGATPWSIRPSILWVLEGTPPQLPEMLGERAASRLGLASKMAATKPMLIATLCAGLLNQRGGPDFEGGEITGGDASCGIWVNYIDVGAAQQALVTVLAFINETLDELPQSRVDGELRKLDECCEVSHPNFQIKMLQQAAHRRSIPYLRAGAPQIWQFGWGNRSTLFWETSSNKDGLVAYQLSKNKIAQKNLIRGLGLPTPRAEMLDRNQPVAPAIESVGFPCVVKPIDRGGGKGVTADLKSIEEVERAVAIARGFSAQPLLVEAHEPGFDHRLMIVDGKLAAAARRDPPQVQGNGQQTIAELLAEENKRRDTPEALAIYRRPILIDEALSLHLARQGLSMDSVPESGRRIVVRSNSNLSTGGTATDLSSAVHPEVRNMAETLAAAIGLRTAGVDYVSPRIDRSHDEVGGGFIEINATPGLDVFSVAGVDHIAIAGLVLGDLPAAIAVHLLLVNEQNRERVWDGIRNAFSGTGDARVRSDAAECGGMRLGSSSLTPIELVEAALRRQELNRLAVVWTGAEILRWGAPAQRLEQVILCGARVHAPWIDLFTRIAQKVTVADDPEETIQLAGEGP